MKKLIIVGNSICAVMMKHYIEDTYFGQVVAFTVDKDFISEKIIENIPVISSEEIVNYYSQNEYLLIMGIGYKKMGDIRKNLYEKYKSLGYTFDNYIHPSAILPRNFSMGEGNVILEGVIFGIDSQINNCNLIYSGAVIGHDTAMGNYNTMSVSSALAGCCTLGDSCFIGLSATVRDCVKLGNKVLVGAGAYVYKDMPDLSVCKAPKSEIDYNMKSTDYL